MAIDQTDKQTTRKTAGALCVQMMCPQRAGTFLDVRLSRWINHFGCDQVRSRKMLRLLLTLCLICLVAPEPAVNLSVTMATQSPENATNHNHAQIGTASSPGAKHSQFYEEIYGDYSHDVNVTDQSMMYSDMEEVYDFDALEDQTDIDSDLHGQSEEGANLNKTRKRHRKGQKAKIRPRLRRPPKPVPTFYPEANSTLWLHQPNSTQRPMSPEERLLRDLFRFYTPEARAGVDSSETVTAHVQYTLMRIRKLDERTQVFTTAGLVITEWEDIRLQWQPEDYDNVSDLVVPPFYVWLPELTLMNAAEHMTQDFDRMGVLVSHTGRIHWEPGGIFSTTCDMDITFFPFDIQTCSIVVGTWAYYSQRLNLTNATSVVSLHDYTEHGEWEILSTGVSWGETTLPCCPDVSYPYVMSTLHLKRRTLFYLINTILPCVILSVLVLVGFCIPLEAGEKISCGISVLLAFTVFLLMVSECIPRTSLQVPIIVIYLTCTMLLGTVSMALSIIVLNVHYTHENEQVPRWVERFVLTGLARALCMHANRGGGETGATDSDSSGPESDGDPYTSNQHARTSMLHNNFISKQQLQIKEKSAFRILGKNAKRLKCFSCRRGRSKRRGEVQDTRLPYEWREVTRVLDRLFFVIVAILMTLSTFLTLYAPVYAAHSLDL